MIGYLSQLKLPNMKSGQQLSSSLSRVATLNPLGDDELFGEGLDSDEDEEMGRESNPKKTDTAKSKPGPGVVTKLFKLTLYSIQSVEFGVNIDCLKGFFKQKTKKVTRPDSD